MKIFSVLSLLILWMLSSNVLANNIGNAFDKRENWQGKTNLGDPNKAQKFLNHDKDTVHLQGLRDSSLIEEGQKKLRNNPMGKTLQNAELKKIEAIDRHKINAQKPMLQDSMRIEENPMSRTGGGQLRASEEKIAIKIKKTCTEGVDFDVDVGVELVLEAEEVDYLGEWERKDFLFDGRWLYHNTGWGYGEKCKRRKFAIYLRHAGHGNPNEEIRAHIAKALEKDLELVREDLVISNVKGEGQEHRVASKRYIRDKFRVGYFVRDRLKKLVEKGEYWQVATEGTQQLAEANECHETGRVCIKSGAKTFFNKYEVNRPCWYEKVTYHCTSPPKDGCAHLTRQNCQLQESDCEYRIGGFCLKWKRNYLCGGQKKRLNYSLADSKIYCLGGDCHTPILEENQDFANVAQLAAVNEAQKDCVKGGDGMCLKPINVFPGEASTCKKIVTGMINCCSSMKGWGRSVGMGKCSGAEKGLALRRDRQLCHSVGSYCSKHDPVFGKCLKRKRSFCCFGSKLSRFFHEEGRKQLGISWGSAKRPNCRPLTLAEITSLDYSKFDMDKLFDVFLSKGRGNADKKIHLSKVDPDHPPKQQQEQMKTTAAEKREIRRRAKAEEERLERERLAKIEADRLARLEAARLEKERLERTRLAKIEVGRLVKQIAEKKKELIVAKREAEDARRYWNSTGYDLWRKGHLNEWSSLQRCSDKVKKLGLDIYDLKQQYQKLDK